MAKQRKGHDMLKSPLILQYNGQRAKLHPEGGLSFSVYVPKIGWVSNDEGECTPRDPFLEMLADKMRSEL